MLENVKLMAIIREVEPDDALEIIGGLVEEGMKYFEISLSDPELGLECIRRAQEKYLGTDVFIGAGTVSKKEEIDRLVNMKVPYILTPGFDPVIVEYAQSKGIEVLPGVTCCGF